MCPYLYLIEVISNWINFNYCCFILINFANGIHEISENIFYALYRQKSIYLSLCMEKFKNVTRYEKA